MYEVLNHDLSQQKFLKSEKNAENRVLGEGNITLSNLFRLCQHHSEELSLSGV